MSQFSDEYRRILSIYQNDKSVNEICRANGISKNRFINSYSKIEELEVFMGRFKSMRSIVYFPGLVRLTIIKQDITKIEGLTNAVNLRYLWLNENRIKRISGLDKLPMLKELYIYGNEITKIEGLDNLPRLEVLWMSDNRIQKLENLENLKRLKSFYVGRNLITEVGNSLDQLVELEELNLAGNRISKFREIPCLNSLKKLKILHLKSNLYGENPVCQLCNYQTYVIFHLKGIRELDEQPITENGRHLAEVTFLKKEMYYNMRIKTLNRNCRVVVEKAGKIKDDLISEIDMNLNVLYRIEKKLEREIEEIRHFGPTENLIRINNSNENDSSSESPSQLKKKKSWEGEGDDIDPNGYILEMKMKLEKIKKSVKFRNSEIDKIESYFEAMKDEIELLSEGMIRRFMVELETGGNIRLEEGNQEGMFFQSCEDLIRSRFFPIGSTFEHVGIRDIKVKRVSRIHNRHLRNQFEEHLESIVDVCDPSYKRSLEYLFYSTTFYNGSDNSSGIHPGMMNSNVSTKIENQRCLKELFAIVEDGFPSTKFFESKGKDAAIPLSNSVNISENSKVQKLKRLLFRDRKMKSPKNKSIFYGSPKSSNSKFKELKKKNMEVYKGYILISKVFLGSFSNEYGNSNKDVQNKMNGSRGSDGDLVKRSYKYPYNSTSSSSLFSKRMRMNSSLRKSNVFRGKNSSEGGSGRNGNSDDVIENEENSKKRMISKKKYPNCDSVYRMKSKDSTKQRMWFIFDRRLILPEYLVEYEFLNKISSSVSSTIKSSKLVAKNSSSGVKSKEDNSGSEGSNKKSNKIDDQNKNTKKEGSRYSTSRSSTRSSLSNRRKNLRSSSLNRGRGGNRNKTNTNQRKQMKNSNTKNAKKRKSAIRNPANPFFFLKSYFSNTVFNGIDENDMRQISPIFKKFVYLLKNGIINESIENLINISPTLSERTPFKLNFTNVLKLCKTEKMGSIVYLNVYNNAIKKVESLGGLVNLKVLKMPFNELTSVDGIVGFEFLELLDLGFNLIKRLEGFNYCKLKKLKNLYLNNNLIYRFDDVDILRTAFPKLERLNLKKNRISSLKNYRLLVIRKLNYVKFLDDKLVQDPERRKSIRLNIYITNKLIKKHSMNKKKNQYYHFYNDKESNGNNNIRTLNSNSKKVTIIDENRSKNWTQNVQVLDFSNFDIRRIKKLKSFTSVNSLIFANNCISKIEGLSDLINLEILDLNRNNILKIEGLSCLLNLKKLNLSSNLIKSIENLDFLIRLSELSLENNYISSLRGISKLINLMEFYVSNNRIENIKEIYHLKKLSKLIILDMSYNKCCAETDNYRYFVIFHLKKLKVLDGVSIDSSEIQKSKNEFSGKLTLDLLTEKIGHQKFEVVTNLNLANCQLKNLSNFFVHTDIDVNDEGSKKGGNDKTDEKGGSNSATSFSKLRDLNMENNLLSSIQGLETLRNLKSLNLNNNKLHIIENTSSKMSQVHFGRYAHNFMKLEVLHLDNNHICSILNLQLFKLKNLRILSLKGNEITKIDGLLNLMYLQEINLDKNKIKFMEDKSFKGCVNLRVIHLEENAIRYLNNGLKELTMLRSLFLGCNRIIDLNEIDKCSSLDSLEEIVLSFNPIARKSLYRPTLIYKVPSLKFIDHKDISKEERDRAEIFFSQDYFCKRNSVNQYNFKDESYGSKYSNIDVMGEKSDYKKTVKVSNVNLDYKTYNKSAIRGDSLEELSKYSSVRQEEDAENNSSVPIDPIFSKKMYNSLLKEQSKEDGEKIPTNGSPSSNYQKRVNRRRNNYSLNKDVFRGTFSTRSLRSQNKIMKKNGKSSQHFPRFSKHHNRNNLM